MTGTVVWITGMPSSGKTTLAHQIAGELRLRGIDPVLLDGDEVRATLVPPLGYDEVARAQFYATLANLAAVIARQGHIVLVPATANRRAFRDAARDLAPAFVEIYVDTPPDECRKRDAKGLYAAGAPLGDYEPPNAPDFVVLPADDDAAAKITSFLEAQT